MLMLLQPGPRVTRTWAESHTHTGVLPQQLRLLCVTLRQCLSAYACPCICLLWLADGAGAVPEGQLTDLYTVRLPPVSTGTCRLIS